MSPTPPPDAGFAGTAFPEQQLIESLCPTEAAVAVRDARAVSIDLYPEEAAAVASALDTRRQEFSRGRACARHALQRLGLPALPVPVLADRAPGWPSGVVGSITHTSGLAAATVAWRHAIAGIGIDIESRDRPMRETLDRFIRTPAERISQHYLSAEIDPLRLVFSAKESVHKCVAPLSGVTLGFHDVELDFDVATRRFRARLVGRHHPALPDFRWLVGQFAVTPRFVITTTVIPAACCSGATMPARSLASYAGEIQ